MWRQSSCLLSIRTRAAAEILPVAIQETRSLAIRCSPTNTLCFQMLPISIGCHLVFHQYLFIITSSCEFLPSKHFNFIIWNVNGGREQSVESGTTFSICSTAIPFQIASKPLFLVHTGSWNRCGTICLVTYFSAIVTNITFHIIIQHSLLWHLYHFCHLT